MLDGAKATAPKKARSRKPVSKECSATQPCALEELKARLMRDGEFRRAYEEISKEKELVRKMARARAAARMTQEEMAEAMGTTQSAVARLESGKCDLKLSTLKKYAEAAGYTLSIEFVKN